MRRITLLLTCLALGAAGQISLPQIGFVRDLAGSLRPVFGVAGAFMVGEPVLAGVVSAASSGAYAVASTGSEIVVVTGNEIVWRREAPDSAVEAFGFGAGGRPEWVRFVNGTCLVWPSKGEPKMASFCKNEAPSRMQLSSRLPDRVEGEPETFAPGWLVLRSATRVYLVRTGPDETIYELPEAAQ
ncbi:MAG: hypothetical protein SGI92_06285 [Bryobacteraceae bacterium]|nr:hypothetical protein [Bryobacteraceae bacterium]